MTDLFKDKAEDWDERPIPAQISGGVGPLLVERVPLHASMRVMDFGAGTGLICAHVAPHVDKIYAVDISAAMLERLAAKPELQDSVETVCQNILESPLDAKIDVIVSAMAMHHVEHIERLFEVFAAHLDPGGMIALADLDSEDGSFHPPGMEGLYHHGFDREALGSMLSDQGFASIEFSTAVEVMRDGKRYPVFLVTATKA